MEYNQGGGIEEERKVLKTRGFLANPIRDFFKNRIKTILKVRVPFNRCHYNCIVE